MKNEFELTYKYIISVYTQYPSKILNYFPSSHTKNIRLRKLKENEVKFRNKADLWTKPKFWNRFFSKKWTFRLG